MLDSENLSSASNVGRIARGGGLAGFWLMVAAAVQFLYIVAIGRTFGAALTGAFAFGFSLAMVGAAIGQLGAQETLIRYVAAYNGPEDRQRLVGVLRFSWALGLSGSAIVSIILTQSAGLIVEVSQKPDTLRVLTLLPLCIPFLTILSLVGATLQGRLQFGRSYLVREVGRASGPGIAVGMSIFLGLSFDAFLWLTVVSFGLIAISGVISLWREFGLLIRGSSFGSLREWTAFSLAVAVMEVFRSSFGWTDTIVLGLFAESQEVGIYFAAFRTALLITLALSAFNGILAPLAADQWYSGERRKLNATFKLTTRWTTAVVLPLGVLMILLRGEIMSLFGEGFAAAGAGILLIVVVGRVINGVTGGVSRLLLMTGHHRLEVLNTIGSVILLISGLLWLVPRYGAMGAAAANAVVTSFFNLLKLFQVRRALGIQPYDWRYRKIIVASIATFVGGKVLIGGLNGLGPLLMIVLVSSAGGIIYLGMLAAQGFDEDDRYLLSLMAKRFSRGPGVQKR